MARIKSSQQLMREARDALRDVAAGEFTPVVFEAYEYIGGERGWRLGYPCQTVGFESGVVWSDRSQWPAIGPIAQ